jgi:hypothetical protein
MTTGTLRISSVWPTLTVTPGREAAFVVNQALRDCSAIVRIA